MPLPVIADVFRCALTITTNTGGSTTNVLHFGSGSVSASEMADAIQAALTSDNPWAYVSSDFVNGSVAVTPLDGSSATFEKPVAELVGTQGGQTLFEAAMVVKLSTAQRGASHRGRVFIGPLTEDSVNEGFIAGSTVAGFQTAFENWVSGVQSAIGGNLKVASYKLSTAANVLGILTTNQQRTQRRRLVRVTGR